MNLTKMASELSESAEALTSKTLLVDEKQALMDMQDHIAHTDTAKRSSLADREVFEREYASMRNFYAAAILSRANVPRYCWDFRRIGRLIAVASSQYCMSNN